MLMRREKAAGPRLLAIAVGAGLLIYLGVRITARVISQPRFHLNNWTAVDQVEVVSRPTKGFGFNGAPAPKLILKTGKLRIKDAGSDKERLDLEYDLAFDAQIDKDVQEPIQYDNYDYYASFSFEIFSEKGVSFSLQGSNEAFKISEEHEFKSALLRKLPRDMMGIRDIRVIAELEAKARDEISYPPAPLGEKASAAKRDVVFVTFRESGEREAGDDLHVLGSILGGMESWPFDVVLDEAYIIRHIKAAKLEGLAAAYFERCLAQKTLSPTGRRPRDGMGLDSLVLAPQEHPIRLGARQGSENELTISLHWRYVGSYGLSGSGVINRVCLPDCRMDFVSSRGKATAKSMRPELKDSYAGNGPYGDAILQIRNFTVLFWKGLTT